jgi:TonB family protein
MNDCSVKNVLLMVKKVLLFIFVVLVKVSSAQEGENPLPFIQQEPKFDTAPRYPGGTESIIKYFQDSIRYPEPEKTKRIQGDVSVKFVVTRKGKIKNVELVNGVPGGPNLAKEAVRLIQYMPLWEPANKNGKPVDAESYLSVPFIIERDSMRLNELGY